MNDLVDLGKFLTVCSNQFTKASPGEKVIEKAICQSRGNKDIVDVLTKTVLINSLYSTGILDVSKMAEHIYAHGATIDNGINDGAAEVIESIRKGHGIRKKKTGKEIDFYSFATKYANWHAHDKFPIFDNLVMRLMPVLNKRYGFYQPKFSQSKLADYSVYKQIIDALTERANLKDFKYKKIDQGLWIFGKFKYRPKELSQEIRENITNAARTMQIEI